VGGLVDVVNNPIYSTGVGLIIYGFKNSIPTQGRYKSGGSLKRFLNGRLVTKMKDWFKEIF
jgi:cell division protein FtsA